MRGRRLETGQPDYVSFLADVLSLPETDRLRNDAALLDAVACASGQRLIPIGADVCRITFPDEPHGTPAHQDAWYCRAPSLWIAWIPLVACTETLGGLEVTERETTLMDHDGNGLTRDPGTGWRAIACVPGDALLFSGLTPHRSKPNRSPDRPRLSLDLRFAMHSP